MNKRKIVLNSIDKNVTCDNIHTFFDKKEDSFYITDFKLEELSLNVSVIISIQDKEDYELLMKTIQFIYNTNEEEKDNKIFPYIYRYFKCTDTVNDNFYLLHDKYTNIDSVQLDFIENLTDWYSFTFQICFILYFLHINNITTIKPLELSDFCIIKLNSSFSHKYKLDEEDYIVKSNFLIRLWNPKLLFTFSNNSDLSSYLFDEIQKLVPEPPTKLLNLFNKLNFNIAGTPEYLNEIFGKKSNDI